MFESALSPQVITMILDHQALLYPLPVILTLTCAIVVLVFKDRLGDKHAEDYRQFLVVASLASFLSLLMIGLESLV